MEISKAIIKELEDLCFAILVDESTKEQMTMILRYVGTRGRVVTQFFGSYTLQIPIL